jgi:hypothetical protein
MNKSILAASAAVFLAGCGGGSAATDPTGIINVAITDAAVDDVNEVWVEFSEVTLKPKQGDEIIVSFDPAKGINLLDLQDGKTEALLPDTRVPVGPYIWMRLGVNAEFDNVFDSYALMKDGSQVEVRIPSGSQSGLKLQNGFTVTQNMSTNMVIDWDLRQALSDPLGQAGLNLRPALRVTDMAAYGTLDGVVNEELTTADECGDDPMVGNAVYVYEGEVNEPADIQNADTDPVVTATVGQDLTFSVSYLTAGEYTAAFTCQADLDESDMEDDIIFSMIKMMVTVDVGETTSLTFEPPAAP